jgi:hypothetical protein
MAAAALALIDLVDPNWLISKTALALSRASWLSPGPSWPNRNTHSFGNEYSSSFEHPGTLSIAITGREPMYLRKEATSG